MFSRVITLVALATALAGCGGRGARRPVGPVATAPIVVAPAAESPTGWRALATADDAARIQSLDETWTRARAAVPPRVRTRLKAEAALLDPQGALALPAPPPGPYRCRLVRLGGRGGLRSYAPDFCYVDGDGSGLSFTKQTGANLPGGWLHPDGDTRLVFLGTKRRAAEAKAPGYGTDPARNVAGVVERVAPFRWRLVMARAGQGALLDVYELVPVPPEVPEQQVAAGPRQGTRQP